MKKTTYLLIIGMFVFSSLTITSASDMKTIELPSEGNTLYVGGSGPNNYTNIQDAIEDASEDDTIFIYNGLYNEYLDIRKSICLLGENKNNTIIDSGGLEIYSTDSVIISNLKIQNCTTGIKIKHSNNNTIKNNIISPQQQLGYGIIIKGNSKNNFIHKNIIEGYKLYGIYILESNNNIISYNKILNKTYFDHISLLFSNKNTINGNTVKITFDLSRGISLAYSHHNTIKYNNIIYDGCNYTDRMLLYFSNNTVISHNNFLLNQKNINFRNSHCTKWHRNYWNRPRLLPKIILGELKFLGKYLTTWFNVDWRPAIKPYEI